MNSDIVITAQEKNFVFIVSVSVTMLSKCSAVFKTANRMTEILRKQ